MLGQNSSNSLEYVNKKWNDAFFFYLLTHSLSKPKLKMNEEVSNNHAKEVNGEANLD